MEILMTKRQYIDFLAGAISDDSTRELAISGANELIPDDPYRETLEALQDKKVRLAKGAFKRFNPEYRQKEPPFDLLISWLLRSGGLPYIFYLEKKLLELYNLVMDIGEIDPDELYSVQGYLILKMRIVAAIDPKLHPPALRKKRVVHHDN